MTANVIRASRSQYHECSIIGEQRPSDVGIRMGSPMHSAKIPCKGNNTRHTTPPVQHCRLNHRYIIRHKLLTLQPLA